MEAIDLADFKTPTEQKYIAFLWDAFETNYTHGNYHLEGARDSRGAPGAVLAA